ASKVFGQRAAAEALVLAALAGWWWSTTWLSPLVLPSPQVVALRLFDIIATPALSLHILATLARVLASVALALVIGFVLASLAHSRSWIAGIVTDRLLIVLNGMPSVGWALL